MMDLNSEARSRTVALGLVLIAAIVGVGVYVAIDRLDEAVTRGFVVLAILRVLLFCAIFAIGSGVRESAGRLLRIALTLTALGVAAYVVGAIGAVVMDGWTFDPLAGAVELRWYLPLIGGGALLFSLGTVLMGFAGRSAGWSALALAMSGVVYPVLLFPVQPFGTVVGHLVWLALWLVVAIDLTRRGSASKPSGSLPSHESGL